MQIALYGRMVDIDRSEHLLRLVALLAERNVGLVFHEDLKPLSAELLSFSPEPVFFNSSAELSDCQMMISVGGDGTLLDTVRIVRDSGLPILGINTGRLGFLANVALSRMDEAVKSILDGKYSLDKRSLIKVSSDHIDLGDFGFALNEVTIHKKDTASMISIHVEVDGTYMNSYWADGLIICTPTGSTAYSLSCGGPIVMPGSENITFTPIAAHNLNVRPVVISNSHHVTLRAEGREKNHLLTLDSRSWTISENVIIRLERAPFMVNLVMLEGQDFFSTIRNKLMWGIDRRN